MGFGRKVGRSGLSRWLHMLAGVLLAVATTATAGSAVQEGAIASEDTFRGSRRICEIKCHHHHNPVNRKWCIDFCIRYQLALGDVKEEDEATASAITTAAEGMYGGSRRICEIKCQHHHNPVNKKWCIDFCIRYQLALGDVKEQQAGATAAVAASEDRFGGKPGMCKILCGAIEDLMAKRDCIEYCIRHWMMAVGGVKEDDGVTATSGVTIPQVV